MSHEYSRPVTSEIHKSRELLTADDNAADTQIAIGTRKLMAVMFWLLRIPPLPSQNELDSYIEQIAEE